MATTPHYVIIGNGVAGNHAADVIRAREPDARLTIISAERSPYYFRPHLPYFLAGNAKAEELTVRPYQYYKDQRIRLRLGQVVERIDMQKKELYLRHMEKIHYTRLLLALGGRPRLPETLYDSRSCMTFMKTYDDALQLKEGLEGMRRILLIGGDLVSLSVARAFLGLNAHLAMLLDERSFWPLELTAGILQEVQARLEGSGIEVIAHDPIVRLERRDGAVVVTLEKGGEGAWDLVGGFFGLVPDIDFLLGSGLDIERGVIVNDCLQSNDPDVFAAGDCAQIYNPDLKNYWVSVGWHNAAHQGEVAGANMLGDQHPLVWEPEDAVSLHGVRVNTRWWKEF